MSELSDLKDSMTTLAADVNAYIATVSAEFKTLQDMINALQGGAATAQDLIDLKTQADALDAAVKGAPVVPAS